MIRRLPGCCGTVALLALSSAHADHVAYSLADGQKRPLPEQIEGLSAEDLLNLEWGQYNGRRAAVGVLPVENTTSLTSFLVNQGGDAQTSVPVNGIEAIITDSLNRTGRFRLVEREQSALQGVLQEQDLSASGRVSQASGAQTGNILGAEYLVQLVVTDYQADTSGRDVNVGGLLRDRVPRLSGLNVKRTTSRVGMNVRLIDAETSEIIFTKQIESTISESGLDFGGVAAVNDLGLAGFLSNFSKIPIGQATIAGVNEAVYELVKQVGARPTEGAVVTVNPTQIVINLGTGATEVGERFQVLAKGEDLVDPQTGLSLGSIETATGEIEVVSVQEKFSVTRLVSGTAPNRADRVVSTKAPPPLEFAAAWSSD
jgi:curli biogenesis system outer membrane secretion channel CsgG